MKVSRKKTEYMATGEDTQDKKSIRLSGEEVPELKSSSTWDPQCKKMEEAVEKYQKGSKHDGTAGKNDRSDVW